MPVFLDIEPIKFNGSIFCRIELTGSAIKHYESDSGKYYEYIVSSLNGQNRPITEYGNSFSAS